MSDKTSNPILIPLYTIIIETQSENPIFRKNLCTISSEIHTPEDLHSVHFSLQ